MLCDTNGGTLPAEYRADHGRGDCGRHSRRSHGHPHPQRHRKRGGRSLAAVDAGARQIQGTLNGLGERCGNANLTTLIPTLLLKEPYASQYETGMSVDDALGQLTQISRTLDEILNRVPHKQAAMLSARRPLPTRRGCTPAPSSKIRATYEHVEPAHVGNTRIIPMSNQAGQSNLRRRLSEAGIEVVAKRSEPWRDFGPGESARSFGLFL